MVKIPCDREETVKSTYIRRISESVESLIVTPTPKSVKKEKSTSLKPTSDANHSTSTIKGRSLKGRKSQSKKKNLTENDTGSIEISSQLFDTKSAPNLLKTKSTSLPELDSKLPSFTESMHSTSRSTSVNRQSESTSHSSSLSQNVIHERSHNLKMISSRSIQSLFTKSFSAISAQSEISEASLPLEGLESSEQIPLSVARKKQISSPPGKPRKKRRKIRELEKNMVKIENIQLYRYEIDGVRVLPLSAITQKVIGCVIGDDISAENPWKYIRKELIMDNIDLHEESSEFLTFHKEIQAYPSRLLLIGWIPGGSDKFDLFYIVYTLEAREIIEKMIQEDKLATKKRLHRAINKHLGYWNSYGSEAEVDESLIRNFRPLHEIIIETKIQPVHKEPSWDLRNVEDVKDGYVELLPDARYPLEVITKRRVDAFVQASPRTIEMLIQTHFSPVTNASVQTDHLDMMNNKKLNNEVTSKAKTFGGVEKKKLSKPVFNTPHMISSVERIFQILQDNAVVDMYKDDYANLNPKQSPQLGFDEYYFHNRIRLKDVFKMFSGKSIKKEKYLSAVSWDPFISGIFVTAYSNVAINVLTCENTSGELHESGSTVLLWSYNDSIEPRLCLETPRQVTALEFCPYQKDILVGGLINGQIVIWDLKGKLAKVEKKKFLTVQQREHSTKLKDMLHWFKNIYNKKNVVPIIVTEPIYSQKDMITDIQWLQPGTTFDFYDNIVQDSNPNVVKNQFLTSSLDGTISVWDIDITESVLTKAKKI